MKEARTLALYKVQANDWREAEFAAASNQMEAIDNVSAAYENIDPQTCSVSYINKVYLQPYDTERMVALEKENAALKLELEQAKEYARLKGKREPVWLPKVEHIKSLYAASGVMEQMNEHTDAKNLMALWEELNHWLESYNESHGIAVGK